MKRGRKATRKDFYMEIRKSPGRFLSILFIVALGVAFFSGIRASEPDMRLSGDSYFDKANLMDIKAFSTFGVTEDDIRAIEALDGVKHAEGAYSSDFLYNMEEEQQVVHIMSLQKDMNLVEVSEGRLPEKVGECMADSESGYQIGDIITLESGTEDPVTDILKAERLEVVGLGSSPCYLSFGRGSATVGDGSIRAFLVVPEETFDMEVYSEVYLQAEGAEQLTAFTDAYEKCVEEVQEQVEEITGARAEIRKQEIQEEAEEELEKAREELEEGREEAQAELSGAWNEIENGKSRLEDGKKKIADGRKQLENAENTLNSKQKELDAAKSEYAAGMLKFTDGKKQYEKSLAEYEAGRQQAEEQIAEGRQALAGFRQELDKGWSAYEEFMKQIAQMEAAPPETGTPEYEQWEITLDTLKKQVQETKATLDAQEQSYVQEVQKIEAVQEQLHSAENMLAQTKAALDSSEAQLADARIQIVSGQEQITAGREELKKQEKELNRGEREIEENEGKLADALKKYEEGKQAAEEELADAEKEISDAEEELADIEKPKWYVYDRSTLIEYNGFGENAERLGAIGRVFPVLFFLVAALISLMSMTRMVEEQRTSIGTMKALGYSKFAIASKYMGYAMLATAGGSVLGVLAGEKILPYIIVYAYGILYKHLPQILVPYQWSYAVMASAAAVFCTMLATVMACYRELDAQPAILMRPPSPRNGRRVFFERITVLWKRLNFTWKSTVRNLMRYKKRFFMTIFGTGGCMALMLVGFGLKDSCYEIAELQYEDIQLYDGSIYLEEDITQNQKEKLEKTLEKEQDIENYMSADMQNVTLVNGKNERTAYICVLSEEEKIPEFVDFHDRRTKEKYQLSDQGVIVSEKTARLLDAKTGDSVWIKDESGADKEVKIEHICENYLGHYMYFTPAYYEKIYGEAPEYNSIFFVVKDSVTQEQMEKIGRRTLEMEGALSVSYMFDIEKQLDDMLRSLNLVIIVLIISAGMLAFVVLYNLNTVNIAERKRELATLKVLGFYDGEVAQYVYRENILLTFLGGALGVILGNMLHRFIIETVEVDSAMFGRIIHMPSYVYSLALTVLFSLLINGVMYFKLRKIDMVESLKSIE